MNRMRHAVTCSNESIEANFAAGGTCVTVVVGGGGNGLTVLFEVDIVVAGIEGGGGERNCSADVGESAVD